jgi:hypothetical protein
MGRRDVTVSVAVVSSAIDQKRAGRREIRGATNSRRSRAAHLVIDIPPTSADCAADRGAAPDAAASRMHAG